MPKVPKLRYDTERINKDIPIVDVLERYMDVKIQSVRKNFLCPVHHEKTPSAHIYTKSNTCKCFGCGANLKPLDVAIAAMPNQKFPTVCKTLLEDMGYDIYEYSNLREVETALSNNKKETPQYRDYFPFSMDELSQIGLYNHTTPSDDRSRIAIVIPLSQIAEAFDVYNAKKLSNVAKSFVKKHDAALTILSMDADAADILKLKPYDFFPSGEETLIQLWHKDKNTVEKLVDNFCQATISSQTMLLKNTIEMIKDASAGFSEKEFKNSVWSYTGRLSQANTKAEYDAAMAAIPKKIRDMWEKQRYIGELQRKAEEVKGRIQTAKELRQRLTEHQAERAKHTQKQWCDFCTS